MKKLVLLITIIFLVLPTTSIGQNQASVLVVYYSVQGHTRAMAEAVGKGARSVERVTVKVLSVDEAKTEDLISADAIIVGSPVYNANVAPRVQEFINRWPFSDQGMRDKIGAAFVSAGGISAGEELAQLSILHSMLVYGMIVAGGPDWKGAFGASAVSEEEPFAKDLKPGQVPEYFLAKGEGLGKRIAQLALKMKCG